MPSRTSRPPAHSGPSHAYIKSALAYHASQIIVLWVLVGFMSLGAFLSMLSYMTRLEDAEYGVAVMHQRLKQLELKAERMALEKIMPSMDATTTTHSKPATTLSGSMVTSPSGALNRGSLSPDGTKYAGYNDTVKGKIGLAVEILATKKVRYIEILNTNLESTGAGTASASTMGARWVDNSTIEYDVLVTKNGAQVKEVRTTQIFY